MINDEVRRYLLPPLFNAAVRAGAEIMKIYKHRDDYDISLKSDRTPITVADRAAKPARWPTEVRCVTTRPICTIRGSAAGRRGAPSDGRQRERHAEAAPDGSSGRPVH